MRECVRLATLVDAPGLHISAVERAGLPHPQDGQAVTFDIEAGRDGRESATNLKFA